MRCRSIKQLALLLICTAGTLSATARITVKVAAAANLRYALSEIEEAYEAQYKDVDLQINYGASGSFYQQIVSGASYSLFLSADDLLPQKLKEAGVASSEAHIYACGKLALYGLRSDINKLGLKILEQQNIGLISIANPRTAPYGTRSVEILKLLDLWEKVERKIVYGDSIAQAAQFAMSGNCEVGFVALSLLLNPEVTLKGSYFIIPEELYAPIAQAGIVLKPGEATKFFDYMLSDECDDIWNRYGYSSKK
ncbi:MAG: molybdate ABC transporter substrate-binding protein [Rikenellaceae bacterium]